MTTSAPRSRSARRAATTAPSASKPARAALSGFLRSIPRTLTKSIAYPAAGTSSASIFSRVPRKETSAPLARSSAATAMAGTTWPAVPPAATTTFGFPGTARSAPFVAGRAPAFDDAQFASAAPRRRARRLGGAAAGDVEDQADREQGRDQAAVAIGDEGQGHPGQ